MSRMCAPCRAEWDRWGDARPTRQVRIHTIADHNVRNVIDAKSTRARDHRELVRWQQDHIKRLCLEAGHSAAGAAPTEGGEQ